MSVVDQIIELRKSGLSCVKIHAMINQITRISRWRVREILVESGLMSADNTHGGYRPGSGRGDKFLFEGTIYDSYSELCFYLKYRSEGIRKNHESFDLGYHHYTPDFIDDLGIYYEIKNHLCNDFVGWNVRKLDGFPEKLVVITSDSLKYIVSEVESAYTKDYLMSHKWSGAWRDTQVVEGSGLEIQ